MQHLSFLNCNTCDNLRGGFGPAVVWSIATVGEDVEEGGGESWGAGREGIPVSKMWSRGCGTRFRANVRKWEGENVVFQLKV